MALMVALQQWFQISICMLSGWWFRLRRWLLGNKKSSEGAIHDITDSLDPSQITYAQVWEDTKTTRQALSIKEGDKVLCIASGGDNALALLLDNPSKVIAVDFSEAQIAVCVLKLCAIKHLNHSEFLLLMGVGIPCDDTPRLRFNLYKDRLRTHLPETDREFWDSQPGLIENGLMHAGIYEKFFAVFGKLVRPLAHSDEMVEKLFACKTLEEQKKFYEAHWNTKLWRTLFRLYFGDVLVGRCRPFYEPSDVHIGEHFLQRAAHVMCNVPVKGNHYLEYVLTGEISGNYGLPEYMEKDNFSIIQSRLHCIRFVQADVLNFMQKSPITFDAIHISNIFDFVPEESIPSYKKAVVQCGRKGSQVIHWTFVPVSNPKIDAFTSATSVDFTKSMDFNKGERVWFYQTFVLQKLEVSSERPYKNGHSLKNGHSTNGKVAIH